MQRIVRVNPPPGTLYDTDARMRNVSEVLDEVAAQRPGERLEVAQIKLPREDVNGVLNRIGGNDQRIIGSGVRRCEVAVQFDVYGDFDHFVLVAVAVDLGEPHARLTVALL